MTEDKSGSIEQDKVTVIIIKSDGELKNGFGASYRVLVPKGYGLSIFKRFVYSGCKPMGHREYLSLKLESE